MPSRRSSALARSIRNLAVAATPEARTRSEAEVAASLDRFGEQFVSAPGSMRRIIRDAVFGDGSALPSPAPEPFEDAGLMSALSPSAPPEEPSVAGECITCRGPVYHRPGKPEEVDHDCPPCRCGHPADEHEPDEAGTRWGCHGCDDCRLYLPPDAAEAPPEAPEELPEHPGHCPYDGCSLDRGHQEPCDMEGEDAPSPAPGEGRERYSTLPSGSASLPHSVHNEATGETVAACWEEEHAERIAAALNGEAEHLGKSAACWHRQLLAEREHVAEIERRLAAASAPLAPPPEGEPAFRVESAKEAPGGVRLAAWDGTEPQDQIYTRSYGEELAATLNRLFAARPAPPAPEGEPVAWLIDGPKDDDFFLTASGRGAERLRGSFDLQPLYAAPPPAAAPPDALREAAWKMVAAAERVTVDHDRTGTGDHRNFAEARAALRAALDAAPPGEVVGPEIEEARNRALRWYRLARRLENAIRWALGEKGDFGLRPDGKGAFWWREQLRAQLDAALADESAVPPPVVSEEVRSITTPCPSCGFPGGLVVLADGRLGCCNTLCSDPGAADRILGALAKAGQQGGEGEA